MMRTDVNNQVTSELARAQRHWRRGFPADRERALETLSFAISPGMSLPLFVRWFGDPTRRAPYRSRGGVAIETLSYRHPTCTHTTLQIVFEDGRLVRMRFVIDEGPDLPPRVLGVDDYWQLVNRESRGVRFVLS